MNLHRSVTKRFTRIVLSCWKESIDYVNHAAREITSRMHTLADDACSNNECQQQKMALQVPKTENLDIRTRTKLAEYNAILRKKKWQ